MRSLLSTFDASAVIPVSKKVIDYFKQGKQDENKESETILNDADYKTVPSTRDSACFSIALSSLDATENTGTSLDWSNNSSVPSCRGTSTIIIPVTSYKQTKQRRSVSQFLCKGSHKEEAFKAKIVTSASKHVKLCSPHGNIANQLENIKSKAKYQLIEKFPDLSISINIIFSENIGDILLSLSSTMIGQLMFQLRIVLFSPNLLLINSCDVVLFVIIRFLHQTSLVVESVEIEKQMVELEEMFYIYCQEEYCKEGLFTPAQCLNENCAVLVTDFPSFSSASNTSLMR